MSILFKNTMNKGLARLRFMLGDWDVKAYVLSENSEWISLPLPQETTITSMLEGACHREKMPISFDGTVNYLFFSWSYDKYRQLYRMVSCDDSTGLMSVLEGNFKEGTNTVVISDITTNTATLSESGQPIFRQLASTQITSDCFVDVVSESYDDGHNWLPVFRAEHNRKK